ncbi:unnamed protein product [Sphenostylis stenocarpa]|uniref:Uncharacterized protein n=1 Tax=Sphenostylis stenocarpa TaxID=92480 RepID=A0AA86SCY2_9FABA|nr:unnamed protein product [Sphenostylis stenocarpa]
MGFPAKGALTDHPIKFLIHGRTGWIGGLLGILCQAQGILFQYASGRLENRASLERDIAEVKPTHVFNAVGCIFEYDSDHPLGSGIGFKELDTPNFTGSFYSKTKAMVEDLLKNYDNVCTLRVRMLISAFIAIDMPSSVDKVEMYAKLFFTMLNRSGCNKTKASSEMKSCTIFSASQAFLLRAV